MSTGKGEQVFIELGDSSDEEEGYGTPITSGHARDDSQPAAESDAEADQLPFFLLDERNLEPFADDFAYKEAPEPVDPEEVCLNRVLEVFPDIDHEHVRQLYKARPVIAGEAAPHNDPSEHLIVKVLDAGTYPKEKDRRKELKRKRAASAASSQGETAAWEVAEREKATTQYSEEARNLLKEEFPYIPTRFVDQTFRQHGHLYPTYFALEREERTYDESKFPPYNRIKNPRKQKASSCLSPFPMSPPGPLVIELLKELEAARKKRRKEDTKRQLQKDEEDAEASNEREHRENGMMMECQTTSNSPNVLL
ncbi:MAG: hypothetical protein M1830_005302 [Pleopsidium flavum]|nr:MAG: hypothetical protein M1830_005302 [Pleopsidium flavum]